MTGNTTDETNLPIRREEEAAPSVNWARAGLKLVPYIGSALDELAFGRVEEARWKRLERTLHELGDMMQQRQVSADEVKKEEFGQLLESVAPEVSRTTSERKRVLLRNLLANAVGLPVGDSQWESAKLAAELIKGLDAPELAVLSALSKLGARGPVKAELRAVADGKQAETQLEGGVGASVVLDYEWLVMERARRKITGARLVFGGSIGVKRFEGLALTELGEFLIDWARGEPAKDGAESEGSGPGV